MTSGTTGKGPLPRWYLATFTAIGQWLWSSGQPARLLLVDPSSNPAEVGKF